MRAEIFVYVAGPYSARTSWQTDRNIQRAREAGAELVRAGLFPVVPHANTAHYDGLADYEFFATGTMTLMRRTCDAVLLLPNWADSAGAVLERAQAEKDGIPVFTSVGVIQEHFQRETK